MSTSNKWWDLNLENKPDFDMAMKRIYAWYNGEIIDRAPIIFYGHGWFVRENFKNKHWDTFKDKWFDVEYQVESFIDSIKNRKFLAETFPIYFPNLGPNVYSAFYGADLDFRETTSWAIPCIQNWDDLNKLHFDWNNPYFKKIEELTQYALDRCEGKFMVGYTDIHPGVDCVAAWRDSQDLCTDLYDYPDEVKSAINKAIADFKEIFNHFDTMLKKKNQLSASWLGVPSFGKMHIPSCDFSSMISEKHFIDFCLPVLHKEVEDITHVIWHLDGKDCARHLDTLLSVPEIQAIQWVQGDGAKPIMQWVPLIKKIQNAGKSVLVSLEESELNDFISAVNPEGIFLCMFNNNEEEQKQIIKRVEKWV